MATTPSTFPNEQAQFTTSGAGSVSIKLYVDGVLTLNTSMNLDVANPGPYFTPIYNYTGPAGSSAHTLWVITPYTGPNLTGTVGAAVSAQDIVDR